MLETLARFSPVMLMAGALLGIRGAGRAFSEASAGVLDLSVATALFLVAAAAAAHDLRGDKKYKARSISTLATSSFGLLLVGLAIFIHLTMG